MEKAFIKLDIVKVFDDDVKAVTESGKEIYIPIKDLIPADQTVPEIDTSEGCVRIAGRKLEPEEIKAYLQLHDAMLEKYEALIAQGPNMSEWAEHIKKRFQRVY